MQENLFASSILLPPSYETATNNQQIDALANSHSEFVLPPQKFVPPQEATSYRVLTPLVWGKHPVPIQCINCKQNITTLPTAKVGLITYVSSLALFLSGIFLCCCWVSFCVDTFKDVHHVCPNCCSTVGVYKRL